MTVITNVSSYSHDHFQNFPMLQDARKQRLDAGGEDLIDRVLKHLFVTAGMEKKFGLSMVHRHFSILPDQKMIEYMGASCAWSSVPGMDEPNAHMWAFDQDGHIRPTEFRYSRQADEVNFGEEEMSFFSQVKEKLDELDVSQLFGLARYPGDDFPGSCEITQGGVNIKLHPRDYPDNVIHIPTIWFFSDELYKRGCRCTCNMNAAGHPHGMHVYTVSG